MPKDSFYYYTCIGKIENIYPNLRPPAYIHTIVLHVLRLKFSHNAALQQLYEQSSVIIMPFAIFLFMALALSSHLRVRRHICALSI